MIPTLFIVGASGSGKTTLIEAVVKELVQRDLAVGYIKHGPPNFVMDVEGKDSWRIRRAGAKAVAIENGPRIGLNLEAWQQSGPLAIGSLLFPDTLDLIIVEGYKSTSYEKIEVFRQTHSTTPCCTPAEGVIAYATDDCYSLSKEVPHLDLAKPIAVSDFIQEWQRERAAFIHEQVDVKVDGVPLAVNDFVANTLARTTRALFANLRGAHPLAWLKIDVNKKDSCQVRVNAPKTTIAMKPFIEKMIASTLRGFLMSLAGGPGQNTAFTIEIAAEEPLKAPKV